MLELHFTDGHVETHKPPRAGPHWMIGARHGKAGPVTWFVLDRHERGVSVYVEVCTTDD